MSRMEHAPTLRVTLITGRTIEQGVGKEQGKTSKEYMESVSVCYIDPRDLKKLGIKDKTTIQISTRYGSVLLTALKSPRSPHLGTVFVPYGPWANLIVDPHTESIGMPSLKGIPAVVEPKPDDQVLSLKQLLNERFRKG
jgi:formylmethanofuran dehydrogenase subunit D